VLKPGARRADQTGMEHTVDYRLLDRFIESRRLNAQQPEETLRWLEPLRRRDPEMQQASSGGAGRGARALEPRD
jgi:hypothetical protein